MECLLQCEIDEDHLRILFIETIPKGSMGNGEMLGLSSAKFSGMGKTIILLSMVLRRYGTFLFSLGFLLPPQGPRLKNAEGKVAIG